MNILRHKGINITFIIQYFGRSVNLFILIHPDGGVLFWRWLKNFCKYFHRKPYIQGLKCRYSEGLTFMLTIFIGKSKNLSEKPSPFAAFLSVW